MIVLLVSSFFSDSVASISSVSSMMSSGGGVGLLGVGGVDLLRCRCGVFWRRCRSSGGGVGLLGVGGDVGFHPGRDGWDGRRGKRFFRGAELLMLQHPKR